MKDEFHVRDALSNFELMKDARLQENIDGIKQALAEGKIDYAANVLLKNLYAKHKELTLLDLLAVMPQEGFDEPRKLIREKYYRAAAGQINRLIHSGLGLWKPNEKEKVIMQNFWDWYCG